MKKINLLLILFAAVLSAGCSVVFTSSITGSVVDNDLYENGSTAAGIGDMEIYLYTEVKERNADYEAWLKDENRIPDTPEDGDPLYFLKTITDSEGDYTFNGFIWNELFPEYGKSGDRKEIYMLFYHKDYGLSKTAYPVYVVSDVTNRIPLFKLKKIMNTADIAGSVVDKESGEALANTNVYIWIPEAWSYTAAGSIDTDESSSNKFSWNDNPSYTVLTDELGEWQQSISYKMLPSSSSNKGTTVLRITYGANGYIAENAADSDITDGGWDRDGNDIIDSDENEGYFQSGEITADSYSELGEIALSNEYNTAVVSGRLVNTNTNDGEPDVSVRIWVAEDWSYDSSDPKDISAADSAQCIWSENPEYTLTTNASGEFSQSIQFKRKPSEADNRKTTRVRLVFIKDTFVIDENTDSKLTDNPLSGGTWDRDGNGTVDADEVEAFFDPVKVITANLDNELGNISVKQTAFSEDLSGEVLDASGNGVNGVELWLFYNPDGSLETPVPATGDSPAFIDTSASSLVTQDEYQKGHFSFNALEWTDTDYTGNQSRVSFYIYIPTPEERSDGKLDSDFDTGDRYYLSAGSSNNVSLTQ